MAPGKKPCHFFQMDKCNNGASCHFAHVRDPTFKRKPCPYFPLGTCRRGASCNFSHEKVAVDAGSNSSAPPNSEALMKDFRWKVPKDTNKAAPLGFALSKFYKQALELVNGDTGTMQEVITLLAGDGGLLRIDELLSQPFDTLSAAQLTKAVNTLITPFFQILTHGNVISSVLLRSKVVTIYNIVYSGDGGDQRAASLLATLATHLSSCGLLDLQTNGEVDSDWSDILDVTIRVFSHLIEFNTPAHANPGFVPTAEVLAVLLNNLPASSAFYMSKARKALERLQQRLGIGQAIPDAQHTKRPTGARATFQLARDMPGDLSEEGRRHDNDHADIRSISILPTLQEIQSTRNEYLPVAKPGHWHKAGPAGLIDRHFRLLREDTVGQLRDAAKVELERLQNPQLQNALKHQGARTFVYSNVYIAATDFDDYHGAQIALGFTPPKGNNQKSTNGRKEWWEQSKRLGPDALICLLSSEGFASFFVVLQGQKPTTLQRDFDLTSDPENAHVVVKPLNGSDIHDILTRTLDDFTYANLSIVEFPGILLASFEPTLRALQNTSESLDLPFSQILAPISVPEHFDEEVDVQPPTYATKPAFKYDLSKITTNNEAFHFTPRAENIADTATELAQISSLDLGQAHAVVASLARSFAAIQGPPGTGKSYTGIQLIRVLLANKNATLIGPIVVCTHTNHALDAILERSVDDGVEDIVRIGGRSKSERLEDINLRILAQQIELTKTEKSRRWEQKQIITKETEEIRNLLESFRVVKTDYVVKHHLAGNHPDYHRLIFGEAGEDDDGFILVAHKKESKIDAWIKGSRYGHGRQRSVLELQDVDPNWMTATERRSMFKAWISEMQVELQERLRHALAKFNEAKENLDGIRAEANLRVLRKAKIIGLTTSGLARNIGLLRSTGAKVLICEEAGEVLEAHMLTALLPCVEHCILIGDHQQLRPQVQNFDLSMESRNGSQYALDLSLFERLVQPQDIFAQRLPLSTLEVQRRMHPWISELVRQTQYPRLQDGPSVYGYPEIIGMRQRLFWMHHDNPENENRAITSRTNTHEVDMVVALVRHLVQQGVYKPADIAVITPYLGQMRVIRQKLSSTHTILLNDRDIDELQKASIDDEPVAPSSELHTGTPVSKGFLSQAIRLATVDNFQGEEAKVIIISLVRSNPANTAGFLKTPNRINVLLSRAQHGMYIIGNANTMGTIPMWQEVIEMLQEDGNFGKGLDLSCPRHPDTPMLVQSPVDFARLSPEAGCDLLCDKQLSCGHACISKCHSDMLHGVVYCLKPCTRLRDGCEHLCPKTCGDVCDRLCQFPMVDVKVVLDCGHTKVSMPCFEFQKPSIITCEEPVKRTIPGCKHEIITDCHINVGHNEFHCFATCGALLPCGHTCQKSCFQCHTRFDGELTRTDHGKCRQLCDRGYNTCKHRCASTCHEGKPCPLCEQKCDTRCSHAQCGLPCSQACSPCLEERCSSGTLCFHNQPCPMPCAAPCTWIPCSERCGELLSCGCRCPSVCGEDCPDAKFCQNHGSDDVKAMQADLIMFTTYGDIDLDIDPCIFTPCGHTFTIDSLDGTMGMQEYYEVDPLTGKYIGLKTSVEPFSIEESKPCPECRSSLRGLARYGRIVRRSLLDQSAKRLTAWSNTRHQELATSLAKLEGELMDTSDFPRKPTQDIMMDGPLNAQRKLVSNLKTAKRYNKLHRLIGEITTFVTKVSKAEQPYQRVHDLVEIIRRQNDTSASIAKFELSSEELQLREHLQAGNLLIRSYLIMLSDVVKVHGSTDFVMRGKLRVDFTANRNQCEELIEEAGTSKNLRQETEAQIQWAKFAAIECGVLNSEAEERRIEMLKTGATTRLDSIDFDVEVLRNLAEEATEVRRMLNKGEMTTSEMRMVVAVMAKEFSGTGHWYRCENGHPFTIGECGMPMEEAKCPECGAGVGGREHVAVGGVTHASDIETDFGGLQL